LQGCCFCSEEEVGSRGGAEEKLPGTFALSAKPGLSGFRLSAYEKSRFDAGTLEELTVEESELAKILTPFFAAWHVWSSF
jgi:hypothetical protein